jgi:uncharacterized phage protein gp47/JayE
MPWTTPTLFQVRSMVRDSVAAALATAAVPQQTILTMLNRGIVIGNAVLRVMSDAQAGIGYLILRYVDWLANQLLPDTAEQAWLDRHGVLWLKNADGSKGRKGATFASGSGTATGTPGAPIAANAQLTANNVLYVVSDATAIAQDGQVIVNLQSLTTGTAADLAPGDLLTWVVALPGVDGVVTAVQVSGADAESDDELRARILKRIQEPPMGGDATDYEQWALAVPGVTRAWASPNEQGVGTMALRFMMDDVRADQGGFPNASDVAAVQAYLDSVRPVTVKDLFVGAPLAYPMTVVIAALNPDNAATWAGIVDSINTMLFNYAKPGHTDNGSGVDAQTIYAAWVSEAISDAPNVISFLLEMTDVVPPSKGYMVTLGSVVHSTQIPPNPIPVMQHDRRAA